MDGYPTRLTVTTTARGFRVTAKFRGQVGRAFTKQLFVSNSRDQLRTDLEVYLAASAENDKLIDVEGM